MGISVSLILIAVGAILTWAVTATVSGIDINIVGVILMIVGAAGLVLSMLFWSSWGGFGTTRTDTTVDPRRRASALNAQLPIWPTGPATSRPRTVASDRCD